MPLSFRFSRPPAQARATAWAARASVAVSAMLAAGAAASRAQSPPAAAAAAPAYAGPIIDVHLHGYRAEWPQGTPPNPVTRRSAGIRSGAEHRRATLAAMAAHGIVLGIVSVPAGPVEENAAWAADAGGRIWPGVSGFSDYPRVPLPTVDALRRAHRAGALKLIGEVGAQYSGMALDDPRLEPYYALAEELDVPIGVHSGGGPPGTAAMGRPGFRMALGKPLALEGVLVRHPKLRVILMHAGYPHRDETIALLYQYPQVYADVSVVNWLAPRAEFHDYLQALMRAGNGDRLLFGSDQMLWPDAIGLAVEAVASAPFLTAEEKRGIFFDNAVRFFRLDSAQVRALTTAPRPAGR
jgi:predicted TIM-barrel fold metal-dependent hydrolase